jgi:predicted NBD/HSP70 family sugar kinase
MLTGTNLKYTKALNHRIVMETIRLHAPISRAEIARRTSLTAQTISNIATKLIDADLVHEAGKRQRGRGAPSITLDINSDGAYSLGLDLDRDHLTGVLVDLSGAVRQRSHFELSFPTPKEAVDLMVNTIHDLVDRQDLSIEDVSGIGVGFPGPIEILTEDGETTSVNPKAFPGWDHVPIIDLLQEHVDLPVLLENNATAAAVGERWYGVGKEVSTFFYLLFGIGLGGGLIINGHPYEGDTGNAAELGYVPTPHADPLLNGTDPTHLGEHYHLPRLYDGLQEEGIDASTPADLAAPFANGSPVVREWLDAVVKQLAPLLVSVEYLIDPAVLVFGGRLPDPLIEALIDRLEDRLASLRTDARPAVPSLQQASEDADAAAKGVATLPIYDLFAPAPDLLFKNQGPQNKSFS